MKRAKFENLSPRFTEGKSFLAKHLPGHLPAILVPRTRNMQVGQCYSNVLATVRSEGGTAITGFLLIKWPAHFLEAMHHAIWRKPDGDLEDVTGPAYPGLERSHSSWFVPDGRTISHSRVAVASKFSLLSKDSTLKTWTKITQERSNTCAEAYEMMSRLEHDTDSFGRTIIYDPPAALQEINARIKELGRQQNMLWHILASGKA